MAVLAGTEEDKVTLICGVSDDLTNKLDAGKLVKAMAAIVGGGGGGRKDRAQAGGKDTSKLPDAFSEFQKLVEATLTA